MGDNFYGQPRQGGSPGWVHIWLMLKMKELGPKIEVFICVYLVFWFVFFFPLLREFSSSGFYFLCVLGKKCPSLREMWNHLSQIGTQAQPKPTLGLKPSSWDSNSAKTLLGTWTQSKPSLGLEPTWLGLKPSQNQWYLVLGPNKAQVLDVSSQKEFSERQSDR